jgi:hypothetical protein
MDRGFLVTLSTMLLLMTSLLFIQNSQKAGRDSERAVLDEQAVDSASYAFDDVAGNVNAMLGPQVEISRNSSESNITFTEQLPRSGSDSSLLSTYGNFIADYSNGTNTNITLDFSGILGGTLLVFSTGLQYGRNATAVSFYAPNTGTNASAYELSIFSDNYAQSQNITSLPNSGSVKLVINYSDLSGSINVNGSFDPNSLATYFIGYGDPASFVNIKLGNFSGGSGSIGVEQSGSPNIWLNLTARGGWNGSLAYAYDAKMNYSQLNVTKNDMLWVERD